jgi:hypothetical protein
MLSFCYPQQFLLRLPGVAECYRPVVAVDLPAGVLQGYWLRSVLHLKVEEHPEEASFLVGVLTPVGVDCLPLLAVTLVGAQFQAGEVVVWDHLGCQLQDPLIVCCQQQM